jgi:hypothetical protein
MGLSFPAADARPRAVAVSRLRSFRANRESWRPRRSRTFSSARATACVSKHSTWYIRPTTDSDRLVYTARTQMDATWIQRPQSSRAIVFVHGILAIDATSWRNDKGTYWPTLVATEAEHGALGVYVFNYETGLFSGSYRQGRHRRAATLRLRVLRPGSVS